MGCNSSTPIVVNGNAKSPLTKSKQDEEENLHNEIDNNKPEINTKENNHGLVSTDQVTNPKSDSKSKIHINLIRPSEKMTTTVGIIASHEMTSVSAKSVSNAESNSINENVNGNENKTRANDTNNNSASSNEQSMHEDEYYEEDDFDMTSAPLSKTDMVKSRHLETQDTLEFVYKNSAKIAPPAGSDPLLAVSNPNFGGGHRMNHRRGSGVPPPPRALKSTDFLARRAAGADFAMTEEDEGKI